MATKRAERSGHVIRLDEKSMEVVASYPTYTEAEAAVDYLSDHGFPVENVRIVGRGISLIEQVTGRFHTKQAILRGAASGAFVGALIGWIFGLFDWINPLVAGLLLALYGVVFGAVFGGLMGWIAHAAWRGTRDFDSISALSADRYELLVTSDLAGRAASTLQQRGGTSETATAAGGAPG